ncbi:MAG: UvrD-helicase domain-containing protein [Candidatus Eisenbacteria bacterium]|uniref:DNA 3'-5' helicase n=1 Tax=Eiseniibacteriota bacterium TaxID=2212470 RepID=A0A956RP20_UNCEI|nr:UvrD-helicase domain-containing protein [Candidatus Eisenbacteria bacterium]
MEPDLERPVDEIAPPRQAAGSEDGATVPTREADSDPILVGLNPVQREAVLHPGGPLLILAGAGSGKTRVLTRRVAHLIERRHVRPDRILAVTFTNKAADEMRSRVESLVGMNGRGLWIGTFHSICLRLLRRHADRVGFSSAITVFDQDDQLALLREVLKEAGSDSEAPRVRDLQSLISMAKNKLWSPDDLADQWRHPDRGRGAQLYREYQSKLRAQSGVDFDDILVLATRLVEQDEQVGAHYASLFEHILVDEYQDTNHVQYRFVRRLAQTHQNITVVGDDDQSIYGWRGADITNILEFERSFPKAHVLRMTQNYRSTPAILEVANEVVKRNRSRLEKRLWTENPPGAPVCLRVSLDEEQEAQTILRAIQERTQRGQIRFGDVTILYRIHAQSRPFEEACLTIGVPYVIVGGIAFYQRREVKDFLAYLRLGVNPRDRVSFRRAIAAPRRGIGEVSLGRIEQVAVARHQGHLGEACAGLGPSDGLRGRALEQAIEFGQLVLELEARALEGPEPLIRRVLESTDYTGWLRESEPATWEERSANLTELEEGAARFQSAVGDAGLAAYLDQVALYTNLDREKIDGDRITLMTVHNAKGLEFDTVFIAGLEEGLFPHASSLEDPSEMEEERRLFYVAATRAMKELTLSASLERRRTNRFFGGGLSRFIREIPEGMLQVDSRHGASVSELVELAQRWGTAPPAWSPGGSWQSRSGTRPGGAGSSGSDDSWSAPVPAAGRSSSMASGRGPGRQEELPVIQRSTSAASLKGRRVRHAVFGVGKVEDEEGSGPQARLTISFPGVGRKRILARFVQPV